MLLLKRDMKSEEIRSNDFLYSQASINSNGLVTIRNYNINNKEKDEIIILSYNETNAIIELFRQIKNLSNGLPF